MDHWQLKAAVEKRDKRQAQLELAWQQELAAFAVAMREAGFDPSKSYEWNDATKKFTEKVAEPKAGT